MRREEVPASSQNLTANANNHTVREIVKPYFGDRTIKRFSLQQITYPFPHQGISCGAETWRGLQQPQGWRPGLAVILSTVQALGSY